ncbi:uncharacterized protein LOC110887042 [Helianthus annuus]|uniref:uncharacterized protein LOC110887042 n=1 Tax=Helianthus annuus TaxID=4232 RepID=UPI000B90902E|nr:uncharacterized protein LOC110887042 [Helianthus annuus]
MASILRCRAGTFPFKYLGLQVGANMNIVRNWKLVVETFKKRLSLWKANTLSFGGRLTLVKYFLWGATPDHKKTTWVTWNDIMAPKEFESVGIGSLREANVTMLAKRWWRFKVDKNSIWRKVVWSIHHTARLWSGIPSKLSMPGPWKQVARISQDLTDWGVNLESVFRGVVDNGKEILFWKDCWVGQIPLCEKFLILYSLE